MLDETKLRLGAPLLFVAVMWFVEAANVVSRDALEIGIRPRTVAGLWGILSAPFVHANIAHLIANTVPFLVLGWLIALRGLRMFLLVTAIVVLLGGAVVWLLGRPFSEHVGASGLVFGYLGFLLARGFFERSLQAVLLSLVVFFFYGGALWGVLPSSPRISWESHLFGALAGVLAARQLSRSSRMRASGRSG
jgi:membrane associated rhomboid family serine protease